MQIAKATNYKKGESTTPPKSGPEASAAFLEAAAPATNSGPGLMESLIGQVMGSGRSTPTKAEPAAEQVDSIPGEKQKKNLMEILHAHESSRLPNTKLMDMKEEVSFALSQLRDYKDGVRTEAGEPVPLPERAINKLDPAFPPPTIRENITEVQMVLSEMEAAIAAFAASDAAADELPISPEDEEEPRTRSERLLRDLKHTRPIYKPRRVSDEEPPPRSKELIERVEEKMKLLNQFGLPAADALNSSRSQNLLPHPVSRLRGIAETMEVMVPDSLVSSEAGSVLNSARVVEESSSTSTEKRGTSAKPSDRDRNRTEARGRSPSPSSRQKQVEDLYNRQISSRPSRIVALQDEELFEIPSPDLSPATRKRVSLPSQQVSSPKSQQTVSPKSQQTVSPKSQQGISPPIGEEKRGRKYVPTLLEQRALLASSAESSEAPTARTDWREVQRLIAARPVFNGSVVTDRVSKFDYPPNSHQEDAASSAYESDGPRQIGKLSPNRFAALPHAELVSESEASMWTSRSDRREVSSSPPPRPRRVEVPPVDFTTLPNTTDNTPGVFSIGNAPSRSPPPRVARRKGNFTAKSPGRSPSSTASPLTKTS